MQDLPPLAFALDEYLYDLFEDVNGRPACVHDRTVDKELTCGQKFGRRLAKNVIGKLYQEGTSGTSGKGQ